MFIFFQISVQKRIVKFSPRNSKKSNRLRWSTHASAFIAEKQKTAIPSIGRKLPLLTCEVLIKLIQRERAEVEVVENRGHLGLKHGFFINVALLQRAGGKSLPDGQPGVRINKIH